MFCIMKYIVWAEKSFSFVWFFLTRTNPAVLHCTIQRGGEGGGGYGGCEYFVLQRDNYYRRDMLYLLLRSIDDEDDNVDEWKGGHIMNARNEM